jgi:hypothetical protein
VSLQVLTEERRPSSKRISSTSRTGGSHSGKRNAAGLPISSVNVQTTASFVQLISQRKTAVFALAKSIT